MSDKPLVLVTGSAGEVGGVVLEALSDAYRLVGLDKKGGGPVPTIRCDLTDEASVADAMKELRAHHGEKLASVVHLAGYFDFTGDDNPLYHSLNVEGTRRLLRGLRPFDLEQFAYAGTMLVHAAVDPGQRFDEDRRLDPQWIYPESKAEAEAVIRAEHGSVPYVLLHLAGLYSERTLVPTLAHQIARIRERDLQSHLYSGDMRAGQSMLHHADFAGAIRRVVDRRGEIGSTTILLGEPDPPGYGALQDRIGELIHGEEWATVRVPAALAAAGAWVEEMALPHLPEAVGGGREPFVRPFMAWMASDNYALDISRARGLLDWLPEHRLWEDLPAIVAGLERDPAGWYERNIGHPPPG